MRRVLIVILTTLALLPDVWASEGQNIDSIALEQDTLYTDSIVIESDVADQLAADSMSFNEEPTTKRHFWRAAAEVAGFNIGLWAFDRYVTDSPWARISVKSMWDNLKHGFVWDNDKLSTNLFFHPYTGNLYYNSARSNGFNYWQSGLFAISGSAMWELILENEYPSINDIIATPIGGMCIGEVTFRASDAIIDNRSRGASRAGREIAVFFINPMRSLTRILTGEAWHYDPFSTGRVCGSPNLTMSLSLGPSLLDFAHDGAGINAGGVLRMKLEYGDRYEVSSSKPFDYFTLSTTLQLMKGQPIIQHFEIRGRLLAREFLEKPHQHLSIGMYQHFDYFDSDTVGATNAVPYRLGVPASVGVGALFRTATTHRFDLDTYLHLNAVLLAGTVSDHYDLDYRDYNLAMGLSVKSGFRTSFHDNAFTIAVNNNFYELWTWKGYNRDTDLSRANPHTFNVMGDKSRASVSITTLRAELPVSRRFSITAIVEHYLRVTRYEWFPKVHSQSVGAQLLFTWNI